MRKEELLLFCLTHNVVVCLGLLSPSFLFLQRFSKRITPKSVVDFQEPCWYLSSSFDEKDFDKNNEEDDDDDDEDYNDYDDLSIAGFRSKMDSLFGTSTTNSESSSSSTSSAVDELIQFARNQASEVNKKDDEEWAYAVSDITPGTVLVANPIRFCVDFGGTNSPAENIHPRFLGKFGFTLPLPADLGADRRADLLPVLMVVRHAPNSVTEALLLNRRTGYLLGDLEPGNNDNNNNNNNSNEDPPVPLLEKFCIQPLWFGGVDTILPSSSNNYGLEMLHLCPGVPGAQLLTEDGLFWGGDPALAQECLSDPALPRIYTGFDFKFFVQATTWGPGELQREVDSSPNKSTKQPTWFLARVSPNVLFKSRDCMGTQRAKPMWTEIMELMGGQYQEIRNQLYRQEGPGKQI